MSEVIQGVAVNGCQCVVVGEPSDVEGVHDCDAMGCSSVEHVLWRGEYENESTLPTDEQIAAAVRKFGGTFHGPNIEHVSMEETPFYKMVRSLVSIKPAQNAGGHK